MSRTGELKYGGAALGRIHAKSNHRKAEAYWLGFLEGVLASDAIEDLEVDSIRIEAEQFLQLFGDEDADDLIQDLDTSYSDYHREIFEVISGIVDYRSGAFGRNSSSKDCCNRFFGFCAGIACDGRLTIKEVERLIHRINEAPDLADDSRIISLKNVATEAISDRHLSADEEEDIGSWIARLVGDSCVDTGLATYGNSPAIEGVIRDHRQLVFRDAGFVVTGTFSIGPRKLIERWIAQRGGEVAKSVSGKTDYLVVAAIASRDWLHSHQGTKIIQARRLREKGGRPSFVEELTFRRALEETL
jgi:NAD-dependent DNA ligase